MWSAEEIVEAGLENGSAQDNNSYLAARGVLRGPHYQVPPAVAQQKLVRVPRGAVFDVAVDIREDSPTLGQWA